MSETSVLNIDPAKIQAGGHNRVRFGLKSYRVSRLAEDIKTVGSVRQPVEVSKLDPPSNGFDWQLETGNYRHAAVSQLNKEGAGLTLPCLVVEARDEKQTIKLQVSENAERENLSTMDLAVAIKAALDAGYTKPEVQLMFARAGGRKGNAIQPLSNSAMNIYLSFCDLPKSIQGKLHDGTLTVNDGIEIAKVAKDAPPKDAENYKTRREEILAEAEAEWVKNIEREEREDERLAKQEKGVTRAAEKVGEAIKEKSEAETTLATTQEQERIAGEALSQAIKAKAQAKTPEDRKKTEAARAAADKAHTAALLARKKAEAEVAKTESKAQTAEETAKAAAKKLADKRKEKLAKKAVDSATLKQKVAEDGGGKVTMNMAQVRSGLKELIEYKGAEQRRINTIGTLVLDWINSDLTTKQLAAKIAGMGKEPAPAKA